MKTVKLSYSIINAWMTGNQEQAIGMYLGQPLPATEPMELGKIKHKIWENHINKTYTLPDELGGGAVPFAVCEQKYEKLIPLNDEIQILFRGVPDCTDQENVYEFKCGQTEATQYVDSWQLDAMKLLRPELRRGIYLCLNPYKGTITKGIKFLTDYNAENALENIITFGSAIIDYLQVENKLIDYKEFNNG